MRFVHLPHPPPAHIPRLNLSASRCVPLSVRCLPQARANHGLAGAILHRLDATSPSEIAELQTTLERSGTAFDMFIHSAGINRGSDLDIMRVNAEAPFDVINAMLPFVRRSALRTVCIITSSAGSRTLKGEHMNIYGRSKAAANDRFRQTEPAWSAQGVVAVVMEPGFTKTSMTGGAKSPAPNSPETTALGVARTCGTAAQRKQGGKFLDASRGKELPW